MALRYLDLYASACPFYTPTRLYNRLDATVDGLRSRPGHLATLTGLQTFGFRGYYVTLRLAGLVVATIDDLAARGHRAFMPVRISVPVHQVLAVYVEPWWILSDEEWRTVTLQYHLQET